MTLSTTGTTPEKHVTVTGKVSDAGGKAVHGLAVTAETDSGEALKVEWHRDDPTRFFFTAKPGASVVVRYPRTAGGLTLQGQETVRVHVHDHETLEPRTYTRAGGGVISGLVNREALRDGKVAHVPFAGVPFEVQSAAGVQHHHTDHCGRYSFPNPGGELTLCFPEEREHDGVLLLLAEITVKHRHDPDKGNVELQTVCYRIAPSELLVQITDGKRGLEGACVALSYKGEGCPAVPDALSDKYGVATFQDLLPGTVVIVFPRQFTDCQHKKWELPEGHQRQQVLHLCGGVGQPVGPVVYQKEEHHIVYTVHSGGQPVPEILVEVRDAAGEKVLQRQLTDTSGVVNFLMPHAGEYQVRVYDDDRVTAEPLRDTVSVHSTFRKTVSVTLRPQAASVPAFGPAKSQRDGGGGALRDAAESAVDLTAYPLLTEEVSFPTPAPRSYGAGAAGTGSLSQTVDSALRDVLGWRPKATDPKGFAAALTQSFNLTDVEGHVEARWVQRSYAVQVQADLGAVTGAQASIYARARVALDQSLPLLEGLTSLRTDILPEDQEATRSIVRSELRQLVNELGVEGGPRVQRVDELFGYLLGTPAVAPASPFPILAEQLVASQQYLDDGSVGKAPSPAFPSNHLGELGLRFGMQRGRVNTIEDEQDLTNFIILVDYISGLWQTWVTQRPYFSRAVDPNFPPYFGTQMVLLSRALAVVGEAVDEVNFTMDSVFLGPAERQTLQLNFTGTLGLPALPGLPAAASYSFAGASPLFLAELLDWISRVATDEGPRFIQDSGKDGVAALNPTLNNLRAYARAALLKPNGVQSPAGMPRGYATPRVQRAIRELADALDQAYGTASQIQGLQLPNE
jgi:hypothetical protein